MGIEELIVPLAFAVFDFAKLALFFGVIGLIVYKFFKPLLDKIMYKYELSWVKSVFLLNLVVVFFTVFLVYLYFFYYGLMNAGAFDVDLQPNLIDIFLAILVDAVRIFVASVIIALIVLLTEFLSSLGIAYQKKKKYSATIKQFIGIVFGVSIILILGLFFFDWVPLGLFVYVFYGGVNALPVVPLIPTIILSLMGAIL